MRYEHGRATDNISTTYMLGSQVLSTNLRGGAYIYIEGAYSGLCDGDGFGA